MGFHYRVRVFRRRRLSDRETDPEGRSAAFLAVYPDLSAALSNDSIHCGKAKASAGARSLRREERFKNVQLGFFVHAAAGICESEHYIGSGIQISASRGPFVELHDRSFDPNVSSHGHRIARVRRQVHQDLSDLTGVSQDRRKWIGWVEKDSSLFANNSLQQLGGVSYDFVQIQGPDNTSWIGAEGQQLPGQATRIFCRCFDLIEAVRQTIILRNLVRCQFCISQNHGQNVVQLVSNPTGQTAKGLHLLRLEDMGFTAFGVGNVLDDRQHGGCLFKLNEIGRDDGFQYLPRLGPEWCLEICGPTVGLQLAQKMTAVRWINPDA